MCSRSSIIDSGCVCFRRLRQWAALRPRSGRVAAPAGLGEQSAVVVLQVVTAVMVMVMALFAEKDQA